MTSIAVSAALRGVDGRDFTVSGNRAWVRRFVSEESGQPVGVKLKIARPFECAVSNFFTSDDGSSFQRCENFFGKTNLIMSLGDVESDPETVTVLREALAVWKMASGHTDRRTVIRETCKKLGALLTSLSGVSILPHVQDVSSIGNRSQSVPDATIAELEQELSALISRLRAIDAGDGKKILSPDRYEEFLADRDD
jgi:hypothetical protein